MINFMIYNLGLKQIMSVGLRLWAMILGSGRRCGRDLGGYEVFQTLPFIRWNW